MLILSHRGRHAGGRHPDNTLAAIDGALAAGMDGVEVDVRRSADGQAVLFHDTALPDGRPVASCSRDDMSRAVGFDVPALDDLVGRHAGAFLDIELKVPDALDAAAPALRRADPSRLLVTSFDADTVRRAAALLRVPCGLIVDGAVVADDPPWRALARDPHVRAVVVELPYADAALVAATRADGISVLVWGVGTPEERARAAALGVDAAIVDA